MKRTGFSPLLADNDQPDINKIEYPVLISRKLDGCRVIFKDGEMLTRSLKKVPNKQLQKKFQPLKDFSVSRGTLLDGEAYLHGIPFQFIVSCFMTEDYDDKKAIKSWEKLQKEHNFYIDRQTVLDNIAFNCFDALEGDINKSAGYRYSIRLAKVNEYAKECKLIVPVVHVLVNSAEELQQAFNKSLDDGFEGSMIRNPNGRYKFSRCSLRENILMKFKPFCTIELPVINVVQSTEVEPDAEKTINELGYSKTSRKKDDRILIERASAVEVLYKGQKLKVTLAFSLLEKAEIWKNKEQYIGKFIEFKFMEVGMKEGGLPRHPTSIRWRNDKD